ncbi:MAG: hypothetical protein Q8P41_04050 [Pseudomonadota bacterium]|nr:hypothetical protein [Pseudomonadota bacterium]
MARLLVLFPLLAACDKEIGLEEKAEEELAELGDPYAGIYAHAEPGYLRTDCTIGVDLYEVGVETLAASSTLYAQGGEWTGVQLGGTTQYTAEANWEGCTTLASTGTGSFSSSTFSGVAGDLFLFRYDGVTAAFETLVQRDDFKGGEALVTFVDESTSAEVAALAESIGVDADLVSTGSKQYEIHWDDTKAVAAVLAAFSEDDLYYDGQPVWITEPEWW